MLGCSCLMSLARRQTQVWIFCTLALRIYVSCQLNLFITEQQLRSSLGLDFGSDVYLIQNGEIQSILKNTKGFHDLIKPLKHSINEIQFTWRSGSRPLPSPLGFSYHMKTWSNNENLIAKPHVSIPVDGTVSRYQDVFTISFPCSGSGTSGIADVGFSLNFTSGSGYDLLKVVVPKQCNGKDKTQPSNGPQSNNGAKSGIKLNVIIAISVTLSLILAFSLCICLYYRHYKKTRRLQMKFDKEYELAAKRDFEQAKPDELDLLNHEYDEEEEENAPPKPIFVPKKKPSNSKMKKWKPSSRYRRSLSLPIKGTAQPAYTPSPSTPSSPGSLSRVLENIPEEREETKEDTEDEHDEENKPMLVKQNASELRIVNSSNIRENPSLYKCKAKKCKNVVQAGNEVTISFSKQDDETNNAVTDDSDDLYKVLNDHWKHQFEGYILHRDQVLIESRPFLIGAFGNLYRGRATGIHQHDKAVPVAVKTLKDSADFDMVSSFVSEAMIMSKLKHRNILKVFGVVIQPNSAPLIVVPLMKSDLNQFLRNGRGTPRKPQLLSTRLLVHFGLQIARGMEYLASQRFIHRDLATRNCMVSEDLEVKISNFGLAKEIGSSDSYMMERKIKLPIKWIAVESMNGLFSEKSDVWSFGVTLWEIMALGKQPYSGIDCADMEQHLLRGNRLPLPKNCPEEIYTIMRLCWRQDPAERPDFTGLCSRFATIESRYKKYSVEYTLASKHSAT